MRHKNAIKIDRIFRYLRNQITRVKEMIILVLGVVDDAHLQGARHLIPANPVR